MSKADDIIETDRLDGLGKRIINAFDLPLDSNGRVNTVWGTKTPIGLALTLRDIFTKYEVGL